MTSRFRVRRYDGLNWVVEEHLPARLITNGRYKGRTAPETWTIRGYYPSFDTAAKACAKRVFEAELPETIIATDMGKAIQEAAESACALVYSCASSGEPQSDISGDPG